MKGNWIFISVAGLLGTLFGFNGVLIPLLLFFLLLLYLWKYRKYTKARLLLICIAFILFAFRSLGEELLNTSVLSPTQKNFTVVLQHPIVIDGNAFSAVGQDIQTKEKILIRYRIRQLKEKEGLAQLKAGAICRLSGKLVEPEPNRNPNGFHYKNYLHHKGIHWILNVDDLREVGKRTYTMPLFYIQNLRSEGIDYLQRYFPSYTAPLAAALLFGDRTMLPYELESAYQRLGIIHLLAISGLHVAIIIGFLFYIGIRIGLTRERVTSFLILLLPLYAILTGGSPSVMRACCMAALGMGLVKYRKNILLPVDILCVVFLTFVFLQPYVLFSVGFQLSFSISLTLLLSARILLRYRHSPIILLLVTSIIAQLASIPILLYYFYEFSISSFLINMIYIPLFSIIILPLLLILGILHFPLAILIQPILNFVDFCLSIVESVTLFLSSFSFNMLTLGRPSQLIFLLYLLTIPYIFYQWEKARTWKQYRNLILLPLIVISLHYLMNHFNVSGEVVVIDVGQGDCILIRLPYNQGNYLIDTGGTLLFPTEEWEKRRKNYDVGRDTVIPFLKSKGITKLDKLILTHGDMDHIGGALQILQHMKVKEVVLPVSDERSSLEDEILTFSKHHNISVHYAKEGDNWNSQTYTFTVLSPPSDKKLERNDQSIVLYTVLGGKRWLFTGDLEEDGERLFIAKYPNLEIDVLKVGHHGSKTSTSEDFLSVLRPEVALISAGIHNRFGHPHDEVVSRLEEKNISIFRSDEDGGITFSFHGRTGTFFKTIHTIKKSNREKN